MIKKTDGCKILTFPISCYAFRAYHIEEFKHMLMDVAEASMRRISIMSLCASACVPCSIGFIIWFSKAESLREEKTPDATAKSAWTAFQIFVWGVQKLKKISVTQMPIFSDDPRVRFSILKKLCY